MKSKAFILSILLTILFSISNYGQFAAGTYYVDSSMPGYNLHRGSGDRTYDFEIYFNKPFDVKPMVYITVILVDEIENSKMRYSVLPKSVSRDGMTVQAKVWSETHINAFGGQWIAYAEPLVIEEEEIEVGQTIQLNNIYFEFAKSNLLPESYSELNIVSDFLIQNPTVVIELAGHTDNVGSDSYNQKLSEARANSVKTYLISRGVSSTRLVAVGYGELRPIATNSTDWGREQNRRVEFTILAK
ncbi:MAG: OmpA family protein [Ignavibacteriales bacterium]|nr:OmpA family protein [Ignavibacteriales bacterium]